MKAGLPLATLLLWCFACVPDADAARGRKAAPLDLAAINDAEPGGKPGAGIDPFAVKVAVLLDRARLSPGVIDGRWGDNLRRAIEAFQAREGIGRTGDVDAETWRRLKATSPAPAVIAYAVTRSDVQGPFLRRLPARMEQMRRLKRLGFTTPREFLAEKFHMSEGLLAALNPGESFRRASRPITVAAVSRTDEASPKAAKVEVRKAERRLVTLDAGGAILSSYPASIGSSEKPAPTGTFEILRSTENPTYTYDPAYAFRGVRAKARFDIAGGPNSPVGSVWIDLSIPSYGIHGTPEPDRIGKSFSHGCIRLTNWDARALMAMVGKGTPVDIKE